MRAKVAQAFQEAARERFDTMEAQYRSILADLAGAATGQFDSETGRPLTAETLWRSYSAAMERFDTFGREEVIYRGYRTAMLMPGLSAAQRRLLIGAALVGSAQELPPGEYPPADPQPVPQSYAKGGGARGKRGALLALGEIRAWLRRAAFTQ